MSTESIEVLWIAPRLNHYKEQLLSKLGEDTELNLTIIAGQIGKGQGHSTIEVNERANYDLKQIAAKKALFAFHPASYWAITVTIFRSKPKAIVFPLEKKLLPLILWVRFLKAFIKFKLVSYNHPVMPSKKGRVTQDDIAFTRKMFKLYDLIVFYTQTSRDWAVNHQLLPAYKAQYANNTLDTSLIWNGYDFEVNRRSPKTLLFIGRLIDTKRVEICIDYFNALKKKNPEIELIIIGNGPMDQCVAQAANTDKNITWCGALNDEAKISLEMRKSHAVIVPGESGLSIIHAFAYGKPYITLDQFGLTHGPEISYLEDGVNGLFLRGTFDENVERINTLINTPKTYINVCENAYKTARNNSTVDWCQKMKFALIS